MSKAFGPDKNSIAFSSSPKHFVFAQKLNLPNGNHPLVWHTNKVPAEGRDRFLFSMKFTKIVKKSSGFIKCLWPS
jgi:GH35 family endo-1,4-beta-xylanase